MDRSNLGRIESGRTTGQLDNVMALALALGVAPIHLMLPREGEEMVEIAPKRHLDPATAREWVGGMRLLDDSDPLAFFAALPDEDQTRIMTRAGLGAANVSPLVIAAAGGIGRFVPSEEQMVKLRDAITDHFAAQAAERKASRRRGGSHA